VIDLSILLDKTITLNQRWSALVRLREDATPTKVAGCGTVRRHGPSTEPKRAVIRRESGESEMQASHPIPAVLAARVPRDSAIGVGERIMLRPHHDQVHLFSPTTGERLY
jgi:hypothetical protein